MSATLISLPTPNVTPPPRNAAAISHAEEVGRALLDRLERHRKALCVRGAALESEIEALISSDSGPERGRAARVLQKLDRSPKPSLRVVQWHLHRLAQRQKHCATL
jgi:hypothetical protein